MIPAAPNRGQSTRSMTRIRGSYNAERERGGELGTGKPIPTLPAQHSGFAVNFAGDDCLKLSQHVFGKGRFSIVAHQFVNSGPGSREDVAR